MSGSHEQSQMSRSSATIGAQFIFRTCSFVAFVFSAVIAYAAPINPNDVHVIDGDTIRIYHKKPDVRLVGFNAPETRRAACQIEGLEGAKATRRVRDLVAAGSLDFEFVPCACQPGKELTRYCNYGRRCGTLKTNGKDVGEILIAEKLAVPFVCGKISCPATPRPWCDIPTRQ